MQLCCSYSGHQDIHENKAHLQKPWEAGIAQFLLTRNVIGQVVDVLLRHEWILFYLHVRTSLEKQLKITLCANFLTENVLNRFRVTTSQMGFIMFE